MSNAVETHTYTLNGVCPCKEEQSVIDRAVELFAQSADVASFVREMDRQRVKGKRIWYEPARNTVFIQKQPAHVSGGGCPENDTPIGRDCHCDHYNHLTEHLPREACQCGAEYYRPLFEAVFGSAIELYPHETVLAGDPACIIAVKLPD